jgi:hypothetical protein
MPVTSPANDNNPWEISIPEEGDTYDTNVFVCHADAFNWEVIKINNGTLPQRVRWARIIAEALNKAGATFEVPVDMFE